MAKFLFSFLALLVFILAFGGSRVHATSDNYLELTSEVEEMADVESNLHMDTDVESEALVDLHVDQNVEADVEQEVEQEVEVDQKVNLETEKRRKSGKPRRVRGPVFKPPYDGDRITHHYPDGSSVTSVTHRERAGIYDSAYKGDFENRINPGWGGDWENGGWSEPYPAPAYYGEGNRGKLYRRRKAQVY